MKKPRRPKGEIAEMSDEAIALIERVEPCVGRMLRHAKQTKSVKGADGKWRIALPPLEFMLYGTGPMTREKTKESAR